MTLRKIKVDANKPFLYKHPSGHEYRCLVSRGNNIGDRHSWMVSIGVSTQKPYKDGFTATRRVISTTDEKAKQRAVATAEANLREDYPLISLISDAEGFPYEELT